MDLSPSAFDDDALEALRIDVLTEQERRQRLADIPAQIAGLVAAYVEGGGDAANLPLATP